MSETPHAATAATGTTAGTTGGPLTSPAGDHRRSVGAGSTGTTPAGWRADNPFRELYDAEQAHASLTHVLYLLDAGVEWERGH